jgi:peptidoglycan/LPS O-acetylase OafA/YrhL
MTSLIAGPLIGAALKRPHNNFTLMRLLLALAVIVSHAFSVVSGRVEDEPLTLSTTFTLGEHAVNGFFAISGFLVTMSFDNRGWRDYVVARTLRIAPALIAATLVVALVLGPALTRLPLAAYLGDSGTWRFIAGTLTTFKSSAPLPGLFEANPYRFPMGTVWTLKYETFCYIGVFAAGLIGLFNRRWPSLIVAAGLGLAVAGLDLVHPDATKGLQTALRLTYIFAAGSALYVWRDTIRLSAPALVALIAATALLHTTFAFRLLLFSAEAYGMILLALAPRLTHRRLAIANDLSYGTYLYGWPVQQSLFALFPAAVGAALLLPAVALTLAVAALSWFLVEKPALALKGRIIGRRKISDADLVAP